MKKFFIALIFCFLGAIAILGQNTTPTPPDEDDVVKITTKLVQLDAVVTDDKGNQVTNLTADDFEVFQDGKLQKVVNFSYFNFDAPQSTNVETKVETKKKDKDAILPPPVRMRPSRRARIITFIVDDGNCSASPSGMNAVRLALEKFLSEQMLPDDSVAIYQTRAGNSLLQQYTSDKTQLMKVVRKIRWYPAPSVCNILGGDYFDSSNRRTEGMQRLADTQRNYQTSGSIGVMRYVVRGLERVAGRKVVFLLSDGLPIRAQFGSDNMAFDALRELTDLANRASVTFNTFDVRGNSSGSFVDASDDVAPSNPNPAKSGGDNSSDRRRTADQLSQERTQEMKSAQDGLYYLAQETGGRLYQGNNYLDVPLRRALNLEKGYYLLGYAPDDETFKGKKYHKLEIRVKRPELRVFSRSGFLGMTDEETKPKKRTGDSELYEALIAPLPSVGLNLRLTAFYGNALKEGDFVRALIHLDGQQITFTDEPDGFKKAVFDVAAVTLDEKNRVVDEFTRTHIFKVEAAAISLIQKTGLIYSTDVPVKKGGTYNFRVAVRDASSKMLGSAGQLIQVPDLKKNNLLLSGLTVSQVDANGKFSAPSAVKPENAVSMSASTAVPAIRQFKRGMILAYTYTLYNAQLDKTTNQPKLTVQTNLYRDGKLISEGQPQPAQLEAQTDWMRINDFGYLRLNQTAQAGDYAFYVIIKDLISGQTAAQWIDFEIVE